jgi:hypothetical protein
MIQEVSNKDLAFGETHLKKSENKGVVKVVGACLARHAVARDGLKD